MCTPVHQVTKTLLAAAASDEFLLIKSGLIMFNKVIEVRIVLDRFTAAALSIWVNARNNKQQQRQFLPSCLTIWLVYLTFFCLEIEGIELHFSC